MRGPYPNVGKNYYAPETPKFFFTDDFLRASGRTLLHSAWLLHNRNRSWLKKRWKNMSNDSTKSKFPRSYMQNYRLYILWFTTIFKEENWFCRVSEIMFHIARGTARWLKRSDAFMWWNLLLSPWLLWAQHVRMSISSIPEWKMPINELKNGT